MRLTYDNIGGFGVLTDDCGNIGGSDYISGCESLPLVVETFGREVARIASPEGGWTQASMRLAVETCAVHVAEHGAVSIVLGQLGIADTEL
jgi:hypothetical protein